MDERPLKHLEMIQAVISRMAQNSFTLKGWAVTLVTAILALAVGTGTRGILLVALLPALVLWGLDGYYLRQERLFRRLYDAARGGVSGVTVEPFSMNTQPYSSNVAGWWSTCCSRTIAPLYVSIILAVVVPFLLTLLTPES